MILGTYSRAGREAIAARLFDDRWVDLAGAHEQRTGERSPHLERMLSLIEAGDRGLDLARSDLEFGRSRMPDSLVFSTGQVRWLAPVPRPPKVRCFSVYARHITRCLEAVLEMRAGKLTAAVARWLGLVNVPRRWYQRPTYYKGNPASVVGHEAPVEKPRYTTMLDYELELGVFIGSSGRDVPESQAKHHVFGYTVFNDYSARDVLIRELGTLGSTGPAKGKDFDTGNAIGPYIVTADEIRDPHDLAMAVRVNGEVRGESATREMHFSLDEMIAAASEGETLVPGEFFGTGAAPGGCGLEDLSFLSPGDIVELTIEGIGTLKNRIVEGPR